MEPKDPELGKAGKSKLRDGAEIWALNLGLEAVLVAVTSLLPSPFLFLGLGGPSLSN